MVPKIPDSKPAAKDKIESVSHMSTTIVMDLSLVSVHSTRWIHRMWHDMNLTWKSWSSSNTCGHMVTTMWQPLTCDMMWRDVTWCDTFVFRSFRSFRHFCGQGSPALGSFYICTDAAPWFRMDLDNPGLRNQKNMQKHYETWRNQPILLCAKLEILIESLVPLPSWKLKLQKLSHQILS